MATKKSIAGARTQWYVLLIFGSIFSGCVPHVHDYKYLSLEMAEDAHIVEWMEQGPRGVQLSRRIPVEYEIERSNYTLRLRIPNEQNGQAVFVSVVGQTHTIDGEFVTQLGGGSKLKYYFVPPIPVPVSSIRLKVFDLDGRLVGQENIPFEIKTGGHVTTYDAV